MHHFDSAFDYLAFLIALGVIAFRCSASAQSHMIKFNVSIRNKAVKYSEALLAISAIGFIVSEGFLIYVLNAPLGFQTYVSVWTEILGFTICGANLVAANNRHSFKWLRFFVQDIIDDTPLPAARG